MTKAEKKRLIDILDLWIESCERFYDTFKNDFVKRLDAVNELKVRCDKVYFMNEFLEESRFISTDKYLEIADRYEKILDKLDEALKTKENRGIKKCKETYKKMTKEELEKENANLKALRKYELNVAKLEIEKLEQRNAELKSQIEKMKFDVLSLSKDGMNDDIDQNIIERLAEKWEIKEND